MERRTFLKVVATGSLVGTIQGADENILLYFVDGYHGGVRGHMPAGAWRDIVTRLENTQTWKLCLDIEASSWEKLANTDPLSLQRLTQYLHSPADSPRVEMVGGTFSQPYGWALTGESNIRQLRRGLETIRKAFPGLPVQTYAMQEPCWASCLPQILHSFGFRYAVLKNPSTAWGGYSVGVDAETVDWVGPDSTSLPTVPRYASENLLDTWRTEAQTGSKGFAEKCLEHGIRHPAGMCFQDLGWVARPNVEGDYLRFVTWQEYMRTVAGPQRRKWTLGIEGIRCALPWGEQTLQTIAQQVRRTETRLGQAEKIASIAAMRTDKPYPEERLRRAEEQLLWAQHHDAWITATTRKGREAWAFQVASETWDADAILDDVIAESLQAFADRETSRSSPGTTTIEVWNTSSCERNDLTEIELALESGTRSVTVQRADGTPVPCQFQIIRKYAGNGVDRVRGPLRSPLLGKDESIGAVSLLLQAQVPATARTQFHVISSPEPLPTTLGSKSDVVAVTSIEDAMIIESDIYRIRLDGKRGGTIASLFDKQLRREFCQENGKRCFHEFRGYFIADKQWQSSASQPATMTITEEGPLRGAVTVSGVVASVPFRTKISVTRGQRRIDIETRFDFSEDTWIGDPWEIKPEDRMKGRRRSEYDDRFKLLALFPLASPAQTVFKNAAFDVCKSENQDTFFNSWDTIKHNIVVDWVDAYDEKSNEGLAVLSNHTTSYVHGKEHPLALVLAWGWDGGYWWGKCPLKGVREISYSLLPHAGIPSEARIWSEANAWSEPLLPVVCSGDSKDRLTHSSLIAVRSGSLTLSSLTIRDGHLHARFFHNSESAVVHHQISFGFSPAWVEQVELDGTRRERLRVQGGRDGRHTVNVEVPPFGLCTLRVSRS